MASYPKLIILKDKTRIILRPSEAKDINGFLEFFSNIPRSDLLIYKDDVSNRENIESLFTSKNYRKIFQLVSLKGREIIGKGMLHSEGLYWQNAAEIKLIVNPKFRGQGIGSSMYNILLYEVFERRLEKVIVRLSSDNNSFIKIIDNYGFKPETVLRYNLIDEKTKEKKDLDKYILITSFPILRDK